VTRLWSRLTPLAQTVEAMLALARGHDVCDKMVPPAAVALEDGALIFLWGAPDGEGPFAELRVHQNGQLSWVAAGDQDDGCTDAEFPGVEGVEAFFVVVEALFG
jgi:hypothetical protein